MSVIVYRHPESGNEVHLYAGAEYKDQHKALRSMGFEEYAAPAETDEAKKPINAMNKAELQDIAAEKGIELTSDMTNDQIRKAIKDAINE